MVADAFKADNSFFSPATRKIKYGSGGVDDAEDADVILHEYGHAIQDDQVPGFGAGNQAGSIGEGFGDFWAAVMSSLSPDTTNADDVCIFDWDGVTWGRFVPAFHRKCGRRADSQQTLPAGPGQLSVRDPLRRPGLVERPVGPADQVRDRRRDLRQDRAHLPVHVHGERALRRGRSTPWSKADQGLTGGANKAAICTEMETNRAHLRAERLPLSRAAPEKD